ncbi:centrosomal protein of 164 kDa isoform X2 [Microplitis demolitor]|uniref:centrosomal protein of 164 kDa isoform X2 n=1 Tax=Microplitis demolitor TaxID=69319 RepID=UPI00235B638E|nr:centrosomal protein of 164 kDa isoform X2 [Microplitis demolitor]
MSISQDSAATIVCREVFDEASHPSNEEIIDYAKCIGINPVTEPHLLDLAREGLMAALPEGWSPCFHESYQSWYYYEASTGFTSWEHPLDEKYKELVKKARVSQSRQQSLDDDSKTTAKDLESHEEATIPKEPPPSKVPVLQTKIPTKLAPLKKSASDISRRKDQRRSTSEARLPINSMIDRSSRDYTNLQFQDPKFYQSPKILSPEREINLREIVKRSESMSPRYEKDWEQLSSKFSSEENVIDIDKLSISSLTKSEGRPIVERFDKEKHPSQLMNRQKELTLTGGGSMFLKSNRSRDNTPCHDGGRFEDFQIHGVNPNNNSYCLERPKSILREKPSEDDDRPTEEERKSVRFDLEKDNLEDIKFTYSGSEDEDWDSEVSEPKSEHNESKDDAANGGDDDKLSVKGEGSSFDKLLLSPGSSKIVGNRFLVQEVSESEHLSQLNKEDSKDDMDYLPTNKFINIKNIDLFSKSDTESTPRTSGKDDSKSGEQTADRELVQASHLIKLKSDLEVVDQERNKKRRNLDEDIKSAITRQHEREIVGLKRELEERVERTRKEMEASFNEERLEMEKVMQVKLEELRNQLLQKEQEEINNLVAEMDEARRKNLEKVRNELETCYEKERQEIFAKLKNELDEKKQEMLELRNHEIEKMENEYDKTLDEKKALKIAEHDLAQKQNQKIEEMKKELDKEFDDLRKKLRAEQREKMTKITEEHEKCLAEISRDYRVEENMARKVFKQKLDEIRSDFSREIEKEAKKISERATRQDSIDYDKIRCEKRLLEDKYKTLKDKYLKLKNDVRLAVEKRSKRKEGNTTASETEKSASTRTRTERTESLTQKTSSKNVSSSSKPEVHNQNIADNSESQQSLGFQRFSRADSRDSRSGKFESDDTTTASETMNSNILQKKKSHSKKSPGSKITHNNNNIADNPVENIRKQLEKLEDLGDQLPTNENAYTLRYPFQDKVPVNASSELEFFRHRIHVERDSVKRARETLRAQKNIFQGVQKAWKERSARATLEQLVQEERELSDMEVSLHRTKSLLGEKVIHLKHLEQSLERVANAKKNENDISPIKSDELTLSDISSASSGFSSTDLDKPDYYQESTEIIASLENLNSEIREIWNVLNKRRGNNVPPPPNLDGPDTRWFPFQHLTTQSNNIQGFGTPNIQSNILSQLTAHPPTTTQNIIAQYGPNSGFTTSVGTVERGSNLIERTRNMRDWLRQARVETTDLISTGQATL